MERVFEIYICLQAYVVVAIVEDLRMLNQYPYCCCNCLLGKNTNCRQDKDYILKLFAFWKSTSIYRYRQFVKNGIRREKRPYLARFDNMTKPSITRVNTFNAVSLWLDK